MQNIYDNPIASYFTYILYLLQELQATSYASVMNLYLILSALLLIYLELQYRYDLLPVHLSFLLRQHACKLLIISRLTAFCCGYSAALRRIPIKRFSILTTQSDDRLTARSCVFGYISRSCLPTFSNACRQLPKRRSCCGLVDVFGYISSIFLTDFSNARRQLPKLFQYSNFTGDVRPRV